MKLTANVSAACADSVVSEPADAEFDEVALVAKIAVEALREAMLGTIDALEIPVNLALSN